MYGVAFDTIARTSVRNNVLLHVLINADQRVWLKINLISDQFYLIVKNILPELALR